MSNKNKHIDHEDLADQVVAEKLYSAESYSAPVRLAVVLINTIAYVVLMDKEGTIPWLAYTVIVISLIYSFTVVVYRPFDRFKLQKTSYFTFVSDALFITLWILASGAADSPFYLLWYVSVIAVGQRFSIRTTLLTSAIYALLYVFILRWDIGAIASAEMFLRVVYIPVIGVLSAYFSQEFEVQVEDKLKAVEAQSKQEELLIELRTIQKELEERVERRTAELHQLNENLKGQIAKKEEAQKEQKKTLAKLAQSNAELENFAHVTSHDLKAPLRGISTIADWLLEDYAEKLDEEGQKNLNQLKQRAKKMNDLIDGILRYSKAGATKEAFEIIDLQQVVSDSVEELLERDNFTKTVEGVFPTVHYNRVLVEQVIQNLLSNAYKYSDPDAGDVKVSGHKTEQGWVVSVADNGMGIPETYREKVFEMFQTLESNSSTDSTGVGLAIVKKVVGGWGGNIWTEENASGGAVFKFTIPSKLIKEST